MTPLKINAPFHQAGTLYQWKGDPTGIGISTALLKTLQEKESIRITIGSGRKVYSMTKEKARKIYHSMDKRNRWRKDKRSVWLVVLPLQDFTKEI